MIDSNRGGAPHLIAISRNRRLCGWNILPFFDSALTLVITSGDMSVDHILRSGLKPPTSNPGVLEVKDAVVGRDSEGAQIILDIPTVSGVHAKIEVGKVSMPHPSCSRGHHKLNLFCGRAVCR